MKRGAYTDLFLLRGRSAIVTGAMGVLGRHFCAGLADAGANICVLDLDEEACRTFAGELHRTFDVEAIGVGCDVSDLESVAQMIGTVKGVFGDVHVLVNNAATKSSDLRAFFAPYEEFSLETWNNVMSVNIDGMFLVSQAVGGEMARHGKGGSIIQTASIYGIVAPDQRIYENSFYLGGQINTPAVYSASKAAVVGLSRYLATYWAAQGIRVNTLVPGGVQSGQNDEFQRRYSARVPLARMARESDMVGAVIYLASDASAYVTGQEVVVDGGLSCW